MRYKAPHFPKTTVLLAEPNLYSLKVARDLCREAGIRQIFEVANGADFSSAVSAYAIDVYVIDQRIFEEPDTPAWSILQARTGADGVAPALALYCQSACKVDP